MRLNEHARIADVALASALLAIQHRAYAVEAELLRDNRIPALHETLSDLVAANLHWWVAVDEAAGCSGDEAAGCSGDDHVVGAIGFTVSAVVDIDRLIV